MTTAPQTLSISIKDETGEVFRGEVAALSSVNDVGPFDILPEHSNFITLITEKLTLHLIDGKTKELPVESGVLRCYAYTVEVYVGVKSNEDALPQASASSRPT